MRTLIHRHVNEANVAKKNELKTLIDEKIEFRYKNSLRTFGYQVNFDFKTVFSEVFQSNGGFDTVIGNPPYVGQSGNKDIFRDVLKTNFGRNYHQRRMDYFYFFFHKGLDIARTGGIINYISTNYYFTATYADKLRTHFKTEASILKIVDFGNMKLFENAQGQHNAITILIKSKAKDYRADIAVTSREGFSNNDIVNSILSKSDKETFYTKTPNSELFDGERNYIRIIVSKKDESDLVNTVLLKIVKGGIPLVDVANIYQGIVTGANSVTEAQIKEYALDATVGEGIFVLTNQELQALNLKELEYKYIKNWYKNSDINKWVASNQSTKKLIYFRAGAEFLEKDFPNLLSHFKRFQTFINKSQCQNRICHTRTI